MINKISNRLLVVCLWIYLLPMTGYCQADKYKTASLHPVSPTAFQFLKYTETPVSEYTGLPSIAVPIYQIETDEVKIPIQFTYHAQGIRVSQEASWVGLGWDLSIGSIVQNINDKDDYDASFYKRLPDYFPANVDGGPYVLPTRYSFPWLTTGPGWYSPFPVNPVQPKQGFALATDNYIPVNGEFSVQQTELFTSFYWDSEPDLFSANFLGHSLKFIRDFNNPNNLMILNKKNYQASKTANGFLVIDPMGTRYYFESRSNIGTRTNSESIESSGMSGDPYYITTSVVYLLTQIVTTIGKTISFEYAFTALEQGYPQYSDKFQSLTGQVDNSLPVPPGSGADYFAANNVGESVQGNGTFRTFSTTQEQYAYLKTIFFPQGKIEFEISNRSDITGGKKLDAIRLKTHGSTIVKSWEMNYSYFDASAVGGNTYPYSDGSTAINSEPRSSLRLKLLNIIEAGLNGGIYSFTYNAANLPKKNSFAQDYWGYYNGKLSNVSLVPDPALFNFSGFANNNDRNPILQYARAGILEEIQYPTKGKVSFEYELNEYVREHNIGWPSSAPLTQQGGGLRVKTITQSDGSNNTTKTTYSYDGGKLITPLQLFRQVNNYNVLVPPYLSPNSFINTRTYTYNEITANGIFSSNPLASINGVGYSKVTKRNIDNGGLDNGKTVTEFHNLVDIHSATISTRALHCNIPTVRSRTDPENGAAKSVIVYNKAGDIVKNVTNTYVVRSSGLYYGARILPYRTLYAWLLSGSVQALKTTSQNLIAYFPIFSTETLLEASVVEEKTAAGSLFITTNHTYDQYNQGILTAITGSGSKTEFQYRYPYSFAEPICQQMVANNRIAEVIAMTRYENAENGHFEKPVYSYLKKFSQKGTSFFLDQIDIYDPPHPYLSAPTKIYYKYDQLGNTIQVNKQGNISSYPWDYYSHQPAAEVINAASDEIAYSPQFESPWISLGNVLLISMPDAPLDRPCMDMEAQIGVIETEGLNLKNDKNYILSYWEKNCELIVDGATVVSNKVLYTKGDWNLRELRFTGISGNVALSFDPVGFIQELRLHPADARMTTFSYAPLIGMTSQCDANNRITYYEYDSMGRLSVVRDQDRNAIKKMEYKYQSQ